MFKDNKVLILGLARSGYQAAKLLISRGNTVYLNDYKDEEKQDKSQVEELRSLGVNLVFGGHPDDLLDDSFDYLIKNPGVPIDHKYVIKAKKLGIEVINEVEMAYRLLPNNIDIIAITGTNGKTTTTTLTYLIMKEAFKDKVHLAGNIGYPLSGILKDVKENDKIVMECSCQQEENFRYFHPHVGICTNITEAHIDFMKTFEHYKENKAKIFNVQSETDIAILNYDNADVLDAMKNIKSSKKYFSSKSSIDGCYLRDDKIYYYDDEVISIDELKIKGMHNVENVMAAIMAVKEYNVSNEIIKKVVSTFKGVEHRLEYVDTVNGVEYYNDTEATNIKCAQIALSSFNQPTIIFLGGMERGQLFDDLAPYLSNVKAIIAIGTCRERVKEFALKNNKDVYVYEFLKDGFDKAASIAEPGDVVVLSPGSASWDQYKECEVRGAEFKQKVYDLKQL